MHFIARMGVLGSVLALAGADEHPTVVIDPEASPDWLLLPDPRDWPLPTVQMLDANNHTASLSNDLIARVVSLKPFFATWDIVTSTGSALRALSPEGAVRQAHQSKNSACVF